MLPLHRRGHFDHRRENSRRLQRLDVLKMMQLSHHHVKSIIDVSNYELTINMFEITITKAVASQEATFHGE